MGLIAFRMTSRLGMIEELFRVEHSKLKTKHGLTGAWNRPPSAAAHAPIR